MNSPVWRRAATLRLDPPENVPMAGRKIGSFFSKQKIYVLYIYKLHIYIYILYISSNGCFFHCHVKRGGCIHA